MPLINAKALAAKLDRCLDSIYEDVKAGRIPAYRPNPRGELRFDLEEVLNALRVRPPEPPPPAACAAAARIRQLTARAVASLPAA